MRNLYKVQGIANIYVYSLNSLKLNLTLNSEKLNQKTSDLIFNL